MAVKVAVDPAFVPKKKMQNTFDFKKARVVVPTTKASPYVLFYVWDVQRNDLIRKRKIIPVAYKALASKLAHAKELVKNINMLLKSGYHIDRTQVKIPVPEERKERFLTIKESIPRYINYCSNIARNGDKELYGKTNDLKKFRNWLAKNRYHFEFISEITTGSVQSYFDYLVEVKGIGPQTYNNTLGRLKNYYSVAKKRKWVEGENPFDYVDRQRTSYGEKNTAYTQEQLNEIIPYVKETDHYLFNFIGFIYYGLMRPSEIRRMRVRNIDFEKRLIRIEASQSKVKKLDILPIADPLWELIQGMNLQNSPSDYFIFTSSEKPGTKEMGHNWSTDYYKKIKTHFGLDSNYSIYGFKHTSVCRWYEVEKDIVRIQRMCRHSTIEMTARYLKSLGLLTDQYKIDTMPNLF